MYAAGKIPGSFFRREGRATDQATLTARLIDRPLRPSFPEGFRNEVHVVGTVLGADQVNPHDVLAINGASAALMLSGIPFDGPIGAVRIAYSTDGTWIPHCTYQEGDASTFELVVAGRALSEDADAEIAIMMVEAGGTERAWRVLRGGRAEGDRRGRSPAGLEAAKTWIRESIELQRELVAKAGGKADHRLRALRRLRRRRARPGRRRRRRRASRKANAITAKTERNDALDAADRRDRRRRSPASSRGASARSGPRSARYTKKIVRRRIVEEGVRIDGRGADRHPARSRPRSASSRPRTARGCSSAATPRC